MNSQTHGIFLVQILLPINIVCDCGIIQQIDSKEMAMHQLKWYVMNWMDKMFGVIFHCCHDVTFAELPCTGPD